MQDFKKYIFLVSLIVTDSLFISKVLAGSSVEYLRPL